MTGDGKGCGGLPKHWMDSGPAALAHSRAFSASRSTTTGERPWLTAMPKHAERRIASPATWKGVENTSARKRSVRVMALAGAHEGKATRNCIHARPAQHVVAAQQGRGAAGHLAQQLVAGIHAEPRVPVAEVVDIEEHQAQVAMAALHAVGLAKQHGQQRLAIVDAGQAVELRVAQGGVAQGFKLVRHALIAQHQVEAQLPVGGLGRAQHEIVDGALGKAIDTLLVTVSAMRTMGRRALSASARTAASSWPMGMPGNCASSRIRLGGRGPEMEASAACAERTISTRAPAARSVGSMAVSRSVSGDARRKVG